MMEDAAAEAGEKKRPPGDPRDGNKRPRLGSHVTTSSISAGDAAWNALAAKQNESLVQSGSTSGTRPTTQSKTATAKKPPSKSTFRHVLLGNLSPQPNKPSQAPTEEGGSDTPAKWDPPAPTTKNRRKNKKSHIEQEWILNEKEMELIWLGEESMYGSRKPNFQWDFIWEHASAGLKVELRKAHADGTSSDTPQEEEWLRQLIRMVDLMVSRRFSAQRQEVRRALRLGYRRDDKIALEIAKLRFQRE